MTGRAGPGRDRAEREPLGLADRLAVILLPWPGPQAAGRSLVRAGGRSAMTGQDSPEQVRRRRERDRVNHARARARGRGEDPSGIGGTLPAPRRVILPVSRAPQTGWQDRAACRNSPPEWFDAETDADAAKALRVCADCPARRECRLAAAADNVRCGVWGGIDLSAAQRQAAAS